MGCICCRLGGNGRKGQQALSKSAPATIISHFADRLEAGMREKRKRKGKSSYLRWRRRKETVEQTSILVMEASPYHTYAIHLTDLLPGGCPLGE